MLDIISSYTRAEAIADGTLRDITPHSIAHNIRYPVAFTEAVWNSYVEFDREALAGLGQSMGGRICEILVSFSLASRKADGACDVTFRTILALPDRGDWQINEDVPPAAAGVTRETHRVVTLRAVCGPGDDPNPVITIMLPGED